MHIGPYRNSLVTSGVGRCHTPGSPCVTMNARYYRVHPLGEGALRAECIQNNYPGIWRSPVVWGEAKSSMNWSRNPRTSPGMNLPEPLLKSWCGNEHCQQYYGQGGSTRVHAFFMHLPMHPPSDMGSVSSPGYGLCFQAGHEIWIPLSYPPPITIKSLWLRHPIGGKLWLRPHLHQPCASDGMGILLQGILFLLKDSHKHGKFYPSNVANSTQVQRYCQYSEDRDDPITHTGYPHPYIFLYGWYHCSGTR